MERKNNKTLHITGGDCAGRSLEKAGIGGEVFVWHDMLYDGPLRSPGWPNDTTLEERAGFLEQVTGGGLSRKDILDTLRAQYTKLAEAAEYDELVLWFDACLFDQSMLAHILVCLNHQRIQNVQLLCIEEFPGIVPFNGLGQLSPVQLASVYDQRCLVTREQFQYAERVERAFSRQDMTLFAALAAESNAPLPWVPVAVTRWLQEQPDPKTGLGRLETFVLEAIKSGCRKPWEIFSAVAAADTPPQYWGDSTLWEKINGLADRQPPLIEIRGPEPRLPQWGEAETWKPFQVSIPSS